MEVDTVLTEIEIGHLNEHDLNIPAATSAPLDEILQMEDLPNEPFAVIEENHQVPVNRSPRKLSPARFHKPTAAYTMRQRAAEAAKSAIKPENDIWWDQRTERKIPHVNKSLDSIQSRLHQPTAAYIMGKKETALKSVTFESPKAHKEIESTSHLLTHTTATKQSVWLGAPSTKHGLSATLDEHGQSFSSSVPSEFRRLPSPLPADSHLLTLTTAFVSKWLKDDPPHPPVSGLKVKEPSPHLLKSTAAYDLYKASVATKVEADAAAESDMAATGGILPPPAPISPTSNLLRTTLTLSLRKLEREAVAEEQPRIVVPARLDPTSHLLTPNAAMVNGKWKSKEEREREETEAAAVAAAAARNKTDLKVKTVSEHLLVPTEAIRASQWRPKTDERKSSPSPKCKAVVISERLLTPTAASLSAKWKTEEEIAAAQEAADEELGGRYGSPMKVAEVSQRLLTPTVASRQMAAARPELIEPDQREIGWAKYATKVSYDDITVGVAASPNREADEADDLAPAPLHSTSTSISKPRSPVATPSASLLRGAAAKVALPVSSAAAASVGPAGGVQAAATATATATPSAKETPRSKTANSSKTTPSPNPSPSNGSRPSPIPEPKSRVPPKPKVASVAAKRPSLNGTKESAPGVSAATTATAATITTSGGDPALVSEAVGLSVGTGMTGSAAGVGSTATAAAPSPSQLKSPSGPKKRPSQSTGALSTKAEGPHQGTTNGAGVGARAGAKLAEARRPSLTKSAQVAAPLRRPSTGGGAGGDGEVGSTGGDGGRNSGAAGGTGGNTAKISSSSSSSIVVVSSSTGKKDSAQGRTSVKGPAGQAGGSSGSKRPKPAAGGVNGQPSPAAEKKILRGKNAQKTSSTYEQSAVVSSNDAALGSTNSDSAISVSAALDKPGAYANQTEADADADDGVAGGVDSAAAAPLIETSEMQRTDIKAGTADSGSRTADAETDELVAYNTENLSADSGSGTVRALGTSSSIPTAEMSALAAFPVEGKSPTPIPILIETNQLAALEQSDANSKGTVKIETQQVVEETDVSIASAAPAAGEADSDDEYIIEPAAAAEPLAVGLSLSLQQEEHQEEGEGLKGEATYAEITSSYAASNPNSQETAPSPEESEIESLTPSPPLTHSLPSPSLSVSLTPPTSILPFSSQSIESSSAGSPLPSPSPGTPLSSMGDDDSQAKPASQAARRSIFGMLKNVIIGPSIAAPSIAAAPLSPTSAETLLQPPVLLPQSPQMATPASPTSPASSTALQASESSDPMATETVDQRATAIPAASGPAAATEIPHAIVSAPTETSSDDNSNKSTTSIAALIVKPTLSLSSAVGSASPAGATAYAAFTIPVTAAASSGVPEIISDTTSSHPSRLSAAVLSVTPINDGEECSGTSGSVIGGISSSSSSDSSSASSSSEVKKCDASIL